MFTKEFKLAAVRPLEQGISTAEVARGLEVNPNVLHRWQRELREGPGNVFPGHGKQRRSDGRVAELERKVGQQTLEIDFLKGCLQRIEDLSRSTVSRGLTAGSRRSPVAGSRMLTADGCKVACVRACDPLWPRSPAAVTRQETSLLFRRCRARGPPYLSAHGITSDSKPGYVNESESVYWSLHRAENDSGNDHLNGICSSPEGIVVCGFGRREDSFWSSAANGLIIDVSSGVRLASGLEQPHSVMVLDSLIAVCKSRKRAVRDLFQNQIEKRSDEMLIDSRDPILRPHRFFKRLHRTKVGAVREAGVPVPTYYAFGSQLLAQNALS